jgi:4-amino-4-deoxy-L-arabinose transferase-like glycosyltransferase
MIPVVFVALIVAVGLYLRFSLFLYIAPFTPQYKKTLLTADAPAYYNLAKSLALNNCFDLGKEKIHTLWAPGFPFFASIIFRLTSEKAENVIIAQIIISALLPVLFFYYTRDIFSTWLRYAVAGLFSIEPNSIIFANLFLSETVFVAILLFFFLAYCRFLHNRFLPSLILSAIFLGLATLIRAVNQYLFIFIALHLFISLRHQPRKTVLHFVSIFFIAYALVAGSWMMRNYYHWNSFNLSSGMGYNLIMNNILIIDTLHQRVNKKKIT